MREETFSRVSLFASLILLGLLPVRMACAQNVSETGIVGKYSVTLKILPAESFEGPHAEMARDSGAMANMAGGEAAPNHHVVVFVKGGEKPVEEAKVTIRYRQLSPGEGEWISLPVTRMHVAGKGLETTHYGNNVKLAPGSYEVSVMVNGEGPATFHFSL